MKEKNLERLMKINEKIMKMINKFKEKINKEMIQFKMQNLLRNMGVHKEIIKILKVRIKIIIKLINKGKIRKSCSY